MLRTPTHFARRRLVREEHGFTLVEMLIVMIIMGILMSISTPTFLSFKDRANKAAAAANINAIVPDIEQYSSDNYAGAPTSQDPDWNGTDATGVGTNADSGYTDSWAGTGHDFMTLLHNKYDSSIVVASYQWNTGYTPSSTATDYCVYTTVGQWYAAKNGPSGQITTGKTLTINNTLHTCIAS